MPAKAVLSAAALVLSPAIVYYAPLGTAEPANTVAYGVDWAGSWKRIGLTSAPLMCGYRYTTAAAKVQEALAEVNRAKATQEFVVETVMGEVNLGLFPVVWEGTVTHTDAIIGVPGYELFLMGNSNKLTKWKIGIEGKWTDDDGIDRPIRFFVYRATATAGGDLTFDSLNFIAGTPFKVSALEDMSRAANDRFFRILRVVEDALAA